MRKIFIYLILAFATTIFAAEINWAKDFRSGVKEAGRFNKPILFVISSKTCPPCMRLAKTTFKDKSVVEKLNREFISVIAYTNKDYIPRDLFLGVTPTIWFLLPSGEPMFQPIKGAVNATNFLNALSIVKESFDEDNKSGK